MKKITATTRILSGCYIPCIICILFFACQKYTGPLPRYTHGYPGHLADSIEKSLHDTLVTQPPVTPGLTGGDSLDINQDGIPDLNFHTSILNNRCGTETPNPAKRVVISVSVYGSNTFGDSLVKTGSIQYPLALDSGRMISQDLFTWTAGSGLLQSSSNPCPGPTGLWKPGIEKYLAIRLVVGPDIFFGWVKLVMQRGVPFNKSMIEDYAYNTVPGEAISAGEKK